MLEVAAEPTRRRLLQLLAPGERTVTQLASQFTVTRSAISQHLGMLAEAGLVTARKQGRERYYRLDERGVLRLRALMESFWSDELDRLVADAAHYPPSQGDCAMPFEKAVVVPLDPTSTFALITQPDRLRRWMAVAARIELRTGGAYRWTVTPGHSAAGTVVDQPDLGAAVDRGQRDGHRRPARHAKGWNHFLDRLVVAGQHGDAGPDEWAAAPDPLDELSCAEATLAVLQHVLRGIGASDLTRQTPCTEYDVSQLADHLLRSLAIIGAAAGAQLAPRDVDAPLETQVADAAQAVMEAWRRRGLAGTVELNSNQVPATVPVGILCLEFLVHAWDFAIATGSQVIASEPVSEYVLAVAGKVITPATRNSAGFAAPAAVGSFAPVLDRLIAFTGRQPTAGHVSAT